MNISQDEFFELIKWVVSPVILRCLSIYYNNPDNFSSNDFEVMLSGQYYENWKENASNDILDETIKPVAWRTWEYILNIVGLYDKEQEIPNFSTDQLQRIIIVTAGNILRNLGYVEEEESKKLQEVQEVYENGKSQGFRQGMLIGIILCIITIIIWNRI